jgi:hypothetical protein
LEEEAVRGGRLRIVNESRYPDHEVEWLVRYGLREIEVKGSGLVALVTNTKRSRRRGGDAPAYSGHAWSLGDDGIPVALYERHMKRTKARYLIVMRLGPPESFPIEPYGRNGHLHDYKTWEEALVGITAHEGMHVQHYYDGAYRSASGRRKPATFTDQRGRKIIWRHGGKVRVGGERIEPKCEAFEQYMLRQFRDEHVCSSQRSLLPFRPVRGEEE